MFMLYLCKRDFSFENVTTAPLKILLQLAKIDMTIYRYKHRYFQKNQIKINSKINYPQIQIFRISPGLLPYKTAITS